MTLFARYLKRVLSMLALLAAIVIVAGAIYVRTASFGRLLKDQASNLLANSFRGEVALGEIDGEWNLMKALASKSPAAASSGSSAFTIYLDKLGVRNGTIDLAPQGGRGPHYRFEAADLDAGIAIKPAGLEAELTELRTRVAAPGMPSADLYTALSYRGANDPAKVRINAFRLTTQASAVSISGIIRNLQMLDSDVAITIDKLAASDLSAILHNYPLRRDITGRVTLKGTANAMHAAASLAAGNSRLAA